MPADPAEARWRQRVEARLEFALPPATDSPERLHAAMRHAVLGGGKRLRPMLVYAAGAATGADESLCDAPAAAVELVHAYSLVHDDLPAMDDDDLRRGRPTVHVAFDEATAILAGDALQALAFELLVPDDGSTDAALSATLCRQLAQAAGAAGMAGGQAIDLASVGSALDRPALEAMHRCKTGALLQASVMMGAATGQPGGNALACLRRYGDRLGLAFQVVDDILDVTTDSATLGKTAGKDAACDKPTFVSLMGLEPAQACADRLLDEAHEDLRDSGLVHTETLHALADWVGRRVS